MVRFKKIVLLVILLCVIFNVVGMGLKPLPNEYKEEFKSEIQKQSDEELKEYLYEKSDHYDKQKELILIELYTRNNSKSLDVADSYIKFLEQKLEDNPKYWGIEMFLGQAYIIQKEYESNGDKYKFIDLLAGILINNHMHIHDAAFFRLLKEFTPRAIEHLEKTEKGRYEVQKKRIMLKYDGNVEGLEFFIAILNDTKTEILSGIKLDSLKYKAIHEMIWRADVAITESYQPTYIDNCLDIINNELKDNGSKNIEYTEFLKSTQTLLEERKLSIQKAQEDGAKRALEFDKEVTKNAKPYNHNPIPKEKDGKKASHAYWPEERGKDFLLKPRAELISMLEAKTEWRSSDYKAALTESDTTKMRNEFFDFKTRELKLARALGDLYLRNELVLSAKEKETLNLKIRSIADSLDSKDVNTSSLSHEIILYYWHLSVPVLYDYLNHKNNMVFSSTIQMLILMRNDEIVKELVERALIEKDGLRKNAYMFYLKNMEKQRETSNLNRNPLNEADTKRLFENIVKPALGKLEKKKE